MRQMTSCTSHVFADMREMNDRNRFKDTSERLEYWNVGYARKINNIKFPRFRLPITWYVMTYDVGSDGFYFLV